MKFAPRRLLPISAAAAVAWRAALLWAAVDVPNEPAGNGDLFADSWVATDGAGRIVPGFRECGPVKPDRWVGLFYWTWHRPTRGGPNDNTRLLAGAVDGKVNWPVNDAPYHWGEPELGYYLMTDPFVIRKHASMLADAGVDVILFDTTNPPFTWKDEYEALCREYTALRSLGVRTPAIAFIAPFGDPRPVTDQLWRDLYQPGRWKDLWFIWEGKPLLLANKEFIKDETIRAFFTFRRPMPDYWMGPSGPEQWSWLEVYPQHVFKDRAGAAEQMSVGVAQNALPNTPGPAPMSDKRGAMGRSWHHGAKDESPGAIALGLNFDEQWRRALEVDPRFIFVTGWNEWVAGRYQHWSKYTDADCYFPGGLFVDEYTQEYSRDCEPMRGGHTDNYYYQLASWVRRFKGVREPSTAGGPSRIVIDGSFADWDGVGPEYRDTVGDTVHRDHRGYGELVYRNETGRNDFVVCKAAYDASQFYFYTRTRDQISPRTDRNWMLLLIDSDQNAQTGWLGYDFVVNLDVPNDEVTTVKRWRDGRWEPTGQGSYRVHGNEMELAIPRALLGQTNRTPAFDFHWADNIQSFGDVSELGVNGDSAPNRRWNYRYAVHAADPERGSGPIRLHPDNPHYYLYQGKPTVLVTSAEHYGAVINKDFDYSTYFDALQAHGLNYTRIYPGVLFEPEGKFMKGNTLGPKPESLALPWARSTIPGTNLVGNKFDLDRWDPEYFRRLRDFIAKAEAHGVVVEICFFNSQYADTWPLSPLYWQNNIQGVGRCDYLDAQTLKHEDLVKRMEDYVRQITTEVNGFDNVILEICDEPSLFTPVAQAGPWVRRLVHVLHQAEDSLPKRHLIAQQVEGPLGGPIDLSDDPEVSVIVTQYLWEAGDQTGGLKGLDYLYNHAKPVEENETDYYPIWYEGDKIGDSRVEAWEFMVGGGGSFNHLNGLYTVDNPGGKTSENERILTALQALKRFLDSFDFIRMHPDKEFVISGVPPGAHGRGISEPGRQYAYYLHHSKGGRGGAYTVTPGEYVERLVVELPPGTYRLDWVEPATGSVVGSESFEHAGGRRTLTTPGYAIDIALRVKRS